MPDFSRQNDCYFASVITGPTHILLGCQFSAEAVRDPSVFKLPPRGSCKDGGIDEERLERAVSEGIDAANEDCGSSYRVQAIHYVEDDTPDYGCYRYAAASIVRRLASGGDFASRD